MSSCLLFNKFAINCSSEILVIKKKTTIILKKMNVFLERYKHVNPLSATRFIGMFNLFEAGIVDAIINFKRMKNITLLYKLDLLWFTIMVHNSNSAPAYFVVFKFKYTTSRDYYHYLVNYLYYSHQGTTCNE